MRPSVPESTEELYTVVTTGRWLSAKAEISKPRYVSVVNLQWARKNGEVIHISQVERGAACRCVCDKCGLPLIAKKGPKYAHHFAHSNRDCDGNQETLMHLMAKAVIADSKRLKVPGARGDQEVVFDSVEVEQQSGPFRVDAIGTKDGRRCMIEIAVTHRCDQDKIRYFNDNKLAVVEVTLDSHCNFGSTDKFSDYVISEAPRRWLSNPVLKERDRISAEASVITNMEYSGFLGQLMKSAGPRMGKLHYGELVEVDLRSKGIPFPRALCVKSPDLPNEFDNLALIKWGYMPLREAVGRRIKFLILFDEEGSLVGRQEVLFPHVDVRWVQGMDRKLLPEDLLISGWERKLYAWI